MLLKNHFKEQFAYNRWAWQQIFDSIGRLPQEACQVDRGFFWGSIDGMLHHGFVAEYIWYERILGRIPSAELLDPAYFADLVALRAHWERVSADWDQYIDAIYPNNLRRRINYFTNNGQLRESILSDILQHVLMHGMEHRSQLTQTLYTLDVATEPLDYIYYCLFRDSQDDD